MRNTFLCNQITRCSLRRSMRAVLLGLAGGATGCSGLSDSDCSTSRTCAPLDAGSSGAEHDGTVSGAGSAGASTSTGSGDGNGGTGESVGDAATPDRAVSDHYSGHRYGNEADAGDADA